MSFIVKEEGGNFTPCPAGLHVAVCVDVVDLGHIENKFKPGTKQHKVRVVWQVEDIDPSNGKPFQVSRMYTASLSEKATLRKDLEGWRGRGFSPDELKGFDLENLLNVCCQLNVVQEERNGKVYGNVQTIVPLGKGMQKIAPRDYMRVKDRAPESQQISSEAQMDDFEDVPF